MMTQNSSCSRIVAVWLVLLAFLCCMMVPALAIASKDIEIEMEGDPRDGLDSTGGGGGGSSLDGGDDQNSIIPIDSKVFISQDNFNGIFSFHKYLIVPIWLNGQIHFFMVCDQIKIVPWGSN